MAFRVASRVAGLGALTAAGQLLIIGSLPAYSRIFDPGRYGEYVIFVGAFTVVSVLAGLRYDSAIVLPRNNGIAAALSALVILIAVSVSVIIVVLSLAVSTLGLAPQRWDAIVLHLGFGLAAATVIGAVQRCLTSWCVRDGRFLLIGWAQFAFCLATVVAQLSFARSMQQLPALIWGYVCALGFQTSCLGALTCPAKHRAWRFPHAARTLKFVARKYRRFPTYMVGYALASSLRDRIIQVVLGVGAGAAVVGRFGLAYRVMFAPIHSFTAPYRLYSFRSPVAATDMSSAASLLALWRRRSSCLRYRTWALPLRRLYLLMRCSRRNGTAPGLICRRSPGPPSC